MGGMLGAECILVALREHSGGGRMAEGKKYSVSKAISENEGQDSKLVQIHKYLQSLPSNFPVKRNGIRETNRAWHRTPRD